MPKAGKVTVLQGRQSSPVPRAAALGRLMRGQAGVVAFGQLRGLGYSDKAIRGMVARRELWRVHRSVYADTRSPMTPRGHLFAALLSFTPEAHAFLSHRTAAALLGLRELSVSRLELTVVANHTPKRPPLRIIESVNRRRPMSCGPKTVLCTARRCACWWSLLRVRRRTSSTA